MPIGSTNVYNPGDLILSTVSGSGTSFIETKIIAATSSFILFNSSGTLTSASLNSIVATTSSYVSGSTSIITNLTASNISASGTGSFGMVGIGTSSPVEKLSVAGNIRLENPYYIYIYGRYASGNNGCLIYQNGTGANGGFAEIATSTWGLGYWPAAPSAGALTPYIQWSTSTETIKFRTVNADRVIIDSSGNVGIGTTLPSEKLHVVGNGLITSGSAVDLRIDVSGTGNASLTIDRQTTGAESKILLLDANVSQWGIAAKASSNNFVIRDADSTERFTILKSDGNIGIGTTSPVAKLEISSSTAASLLNIKGAGGNGILFVSGSGNVGIGTSSPVGKLHVVGGGGSGALVIQGNGITSHFHYGTNEDTYIRPGKTVGAVFIADVGGNVGIGTTTTTAKLHVSGSTGGVFEVDTAGGVTSFYVSASGNIGIGTSTSILGKLQLDSGVAPYYGPVTSSATPNGMFTLGSVLGDVVNTFGVDASATAYAWIQPRKITVASYSNLVLNPNGGNVGIGTTLPASKFHISGSGQTIMRLDSDTTSSVSQFQIKAASDAVLIMGMLGGSAASTNFGVTAAGQAYFGTSTLGSPHPTSLVIGNVSNIPIAFSTNNVERMRIDGVGNVGIGTTSATNKLEVIGGTNTRINLGNIDDVNRGGKLEIISGSATARQFYVGTNSAIYNLVFGIDSIEKMRIDTAGNVGIGTTAPGALLEISSSTAASLLNIKGAGGNGLLFVSGSGAVGIGTTLPSAKLEIIHDSTAATPALYIKGGYVGTTIARFERIYGVTPTTTYVDINGSGGNAQLSIASAANTFALGVNTTTSAFEISDNSSIGTNTRLLIDVNGNVGIGTTSPSDKLHVIGNIRINGGDILNWGGQAFIQTIGANDMFFRPNSTLRMILTAAGNLGLGNGFTSPAYLLDVSGSSRHGYQTTDTHQFTGSVSVSGSLNATASWATNALTASFLPVGTYNITSSWANNVVSASYALSSSFTTRAQTANALNALNTYTVAGLTSAYVDVDGSSAPTTGIYRPSTKTLGLSADGTLIFKISNVSSPATSSIETGNFIVQTGNVGIGTTVPTARLHVSGSTIITGSLNVSANITCLSLTETSTEAVKYNILPLPSQLDNVLKLKPVSFNYKANDKHSIGLIAEEVAKIYPEFTSDNNDSISYGKITSVLIQSIKELKTIIDNQQKQIENLIDKLK